MSTLINEVRSNFYLDSVALMRYSAELSAQPGIDEAVMMIGTPANLEIMQQAGLLAENGGKATPNDLVIAVLADGSGNANRALAQAERSLSGSRKERRSSEQQPFSLSSAQQQFPEANLALISTPGAYAEAEARTALENGLNAMIFSDNVSIEAERALKELAHEKGLLVMGPDCGSAIIANTPLAFANVVADGNIGVIAASGTGLQEFTVLASRLGGGVRHAIGVGGRDLNDAIGAISTLTAIDLLAADNSVECLVLISKPPGPDSATVVYEKLANCQKPVISCVFGVTANLPDNNIQIAENLKQAAELACNQRFPATTTTATSLADNSQRKWIRGLYTGGTLCTEALMALQKQGLQVTSNVSADATVRDDGHCLLDLGADEYTLGKPHPMMDPALRNEFLQQALANPEVAVVLLDVVLGYGAHEDPAGVLAESLTRQQTEHQQQPVVIAYLCGIEGDPQNYDAQLKTLRDAGAVVCQSNYDSALLAAEVAIQSQT